MTDLTSLTDLPLDDLKVLELGQLIAGPYCGQVLADFGAEVIKVEPPGKDDAMRQWGEADHDTGEPLWWNVIGRNKQSLTLDLRKPRGQVVDSSIFESVLAMMESLVPEYAQAGKVREVGPELGEHTEQVLTGWLGLAPETLDALRADGVT